MDNLKKLVGIPSDKDKNEIVKYVYETLKDKVEDIKIVKNEENTDKSIVFGINTPLKNVNPIVLSGHLDTVTPNVELYKTDPYILTEKDGKFYGLGSIDMKSFSAVILDQFEKLKKATYPIIGCFTTDEETTVTCVTNVIEFLKKNNIYPIFTIVGEPTQCEFRTVCKSCEDSKVIFRGKACHSSVPVKGVNAINAAAKFAVFLEEEQKKYETLTLNIGIIKGGEATSKVADYCELIFDKRSEKASEIEAFKATVRNEAEALEREYSGLKIEITDLPAMPPLENRNQDKIKSIANALNIKLGKFAGACEAGYFNVFSGDAVIFGVGDLALAHQPNEHVVKEEYDKYSKLLLEVVDKVQEVYK